VEALGLLAGGTVDEDAVGEHAVDIENEKTDAGGPGRRLH
jgi:hypothetical protein